MRCWCWRRKQLRPRTPRKWMAWTAGRRATRSKPADLPCCRLCRLQFVCLLACAEQFSHSAMAVKTHVLLPQAESAALPNHAQRRPQACATRFGGNGAAGGSLVRPCAYAYCGLCVCDSAARSPPLFGAELCGADTCAGWAAQDCCSFKRQQCSLHSLLCGINVLMQRVCACTDVGPKCAPCAPAVQRAPVLHNSVPTELHGLQQRAHQPFAHYPVLSARPVHRLRHSDLQRPCVNCFRDYDTLLPVSKLITWRRPANLAPPCGAPTDALLPGAQCFCFICEAPARQCQLWGSGAAGPTPAACQAMQCTHHTLWRRRCSSTAWPGIIAAAAVHPQPAPRMPAGVSLG